MSCDFAHLDGSYVLGALSPSERREFEEHLAGCDACSRSVRELAGLPGLLARIDPAVLESPPPEEPLPETLLPALMGQVRRSSRRRTFATAGLAAAAAVLVTVGAAVTVGANGGGDNPAANPPVAGTSIPGSRPMAVVRDVGMRASLAFTGVSWGTRLDLTCTYAATPAGYGQPPTTTYSMVVHTRDGRAEQVATWRALPGRTMQPDAATSAAPKDITSVEVRAANGEPVLSLKA